MANLPPNGKSRELKLVNAKEQNVSIADLNRDEPCLLLLSYTYREERTANQNHNSYVVFVFKNQCHANFMSREENLPTLREILSQTESARTRCACHTFVFGEFAPVTYYDPDSDAAIDLRHWIYMDQN
jgi:hypothetical protein